MFFLRKEQVVIFLFLALQVVFWYGVELEEDVSLWQGSRSIKPELHIVPEVPSPAIVKAMTFGDEQFYFRVQSYAIQTAGDSFGRSTSLKKYDYAELLKWWLILDDLDSRADIMPSMVSYYYGATPNHEEQIPYVVEYLEQHGDRDPGAKWWWYSQGVYHARHKLKDTDAALRIAKKMAEIPADVDAPIWVRQMHAFIHEGRGEYKEACNIILNIIDNYEDLEEGELKFMNHFIEERIAAIINIEKEFESVDLDPRCRYLVELKKQQQQEARDI